MDTKYLTPAARMIIEERQERTKTGNCGVCDGRGTIWENTPAGSHENICFACHGTGKNEVLGGIPISYEKT